MIGSQITISKAYSKLLHIYAAAGLNRNMVRNYEQLTWKRYNSQDKKITELKY